jgi:quercetin dioxygenase-like cupin family protein
MYTDFARRITMYQPLLMGHEQFIARVSMLRGYPSHWHSEIEMIYCMSGNFRVKIADIIYTVREGSAVIIGSMEEHEFLDQEHSAKFLLVEFGYSFLGSEYAELAKLRFRNPLIEFDQP